MERKETEAQAQVVVFEWARWQQSKNPVLKSMYHAANEGKRSQTAGANLKRQGMKPGVSDICLPYAAGGFNNLYIELKVGSNKATEEQLTFIDTINEIGGKAVVVYGSDAAIEVITAYLEGTVGSLSIKNDTYPAEKAKLTESVNKKRLEKEKLKEIVKNKKRFIGFCGVDCRNCDNVGCLGRKV